MPRLHSVRRGTGFPVVILHGGGLDHRHMLDAVEPVFAGREGFERVYLDLPGHGRSDGSTVQSQDDVLDIVAAFCETTFRARFAIIGESRGSLIARGLIARGLIARGLLATMPSRIAGACLIAPGGDGHASEKPEHQTLVHAPSVRNTLSDAAKGRFDRMVVQSAEIAARICRTKLPAADLADPETAKRIAANFELTGPLEDTLFPGPCLILSGRQDAVAGFRDAGILQNAYPRSTFAILGTAGHGLTWERPALFKALMRDWLNRLGEVL